MPAFVTFPDQVQLGSDVYKTIYDKAVPKDQWRSQTRHENILKG